MANGELMATNEKILEIQEKAFAYSKRILRDQRSMVVEMRFGPCSSLISKPR